MANKTATYRERRERFLEPQEWAGYEVRDPLGQKIGQAEEIFMNANDEPEYIRVTTGFFRPKSVLIPVKLAAADAKRRVIELR
jgi:PRC-barrel domain